MCCRNSDKLYKVLPERSKLGKDIIGDLTTAGRKFSLYSGHDTGPMGEMLSALGLRWEDSGRLCASVWPTFGSMLVFEIYSDNLGRFVYNGRVATADSIPECMGKKHFPVMINWVFQRIAVCCYFGLMITFVGSGIANLACAYNVAPAELQAHLPVAYSYFTKTPFIKSAMKFCGIATVPQLMKILGCAHLASSMSIFFQPILGALWMLVTMIGAEYVSIRTADMPGMPNHNLCGKSSPICPATHAMHFAIAVMAIVVMLVGTPVCSFCVKVFGEKKNKNE
ncbi:hypothetical protein FOL47_007138 [Perkinsus chesapeaki]|uniref:Uncharacterized protein n=1 Tax=Perkinsus chesapeaki TaxID=330153 RepID=A0A7J6LMI7_PERCH|nr:hypothetical protein FOL47_007138 [Perkinsus chesapeaki]